MRLAEIIRKQEEGKSPSAPVRKSEPVPSRPLSQPLPVVSTPTKKIELSQPTEAEIREKLQAEYQRELARARQEMEESMRQRLDSEKAELAAREEKIKAQEEASRARAARVQALLSAAAPSKEDEERQWAARLEEERKKFQQAMAAELAKTKTMIEEMQSKAAASAVPVSEKSQAPEASAAPENSSETAPEARTEAAAKLPLESKIEPIDEPRPEPEVMSREMMEAACLRLEESPQMLSEARDLWMQLTSDAFDVFDRARRGEDLALDACRIKISEILKKIEEREIELLKVVMDAYPESVTPFICHNVNVSIMSLILAMEFSLTEEDLVELGLGALFHDIGLTNVREDLDYPKKLTPHLEKEILNHPERGAQLLGDLLSKRGLEAILHHHEVTNGKGYPKGLAGDDIPLFARIVHICDSFEALVHSRPYREKPLEIHEAVKQLIDAGRGVYDREVLKALMVRIGLYPVMTNVILSNKQTGIVVKQNRQFPLSPIVRVESNERGLALEKPFLIDLSRTQFVHILGPMQHRVAGESAHAASHFTPVETSATAHTSSSPLMDLTQAALSILLIVTIIGILALIVVKV